MTRQGFTAAAIDGHTVKVESDSPYTGFYLVFDDGWWKPKRFPATHMELAIYVIRKLFNDARPSPTTQTKYIGSEWLTEQGRQLSDLGREVADVLGQAWQGIHHIGDQVLHKRCEWDNEEQIQVIIPGELTGEGSERLTLLLMLCHAKKLRLDVDGACSKHLRLTFSRQTTDRVEPAFDLKWVSEDEAT
ncbi:MAG: hypothetical protein AAFX78_10160 [Cyanobacteria bacterium J06638_20]